MKGCFSAYGNTIIINHTAARRISCPANSNVKCGSRNNNHYDYTEVILAYSIFTTQTNRGKSGYTAIRSFSAYALKMRLVCIGAR